MLKQVRGSDLADAVRAATTGQPLLHPRAAAEETAKNYVSTLFRKLGLEQRTAAAAYARTYSRLQAEPAQNVTITGRNPLTGPRASDGKGRIRPLLPAGSATQNHGGGRSRAASSNTACQGPITRSPVSSCGSS